MKSKKRLLALLTALVMVTSIVLDGQVIPAIAEETAVTEGTAEASSDRELSGETIPETEAAPQEQSAAEPEVSEPAAEPKTEAAEPVTEPRTEASEPKTEAAEPVTEPRTEASEPKTEAAEPVTEPRTEASEPKTEAAESVTEPKTEASEPVTEAKTEASEAVTEPAGTGTEEASEPVTESKTEAPEANVGTSEAVTEAPGTEESAAEPGSENDGTEPNTEESAQEELSEAEDGTEPESETDTEEQEIQLVEQTVTASGSGDATVTLTGVMPEGARAEAKPVQVKIEGQNVLAAYDITIYDERDQVYQPEAGVIQVSIVDAAVQEALDQADDLTVYHIENAAAQPQEIQEVTTTAGEVVFEAESFSIYVVAKHYTYTYIFVDSDGTEINRQILSEGEVLQEPQSPESTEHKVFVGWYDETGAKFTDFGHVVTEDDLKDGNGDSTDKTLTLTARYEEAYYVFYKASAETDSKVLYTQKYQNGDLIVTDDVPFNTGNVDQALIGWSRTVGADAPDDDLRISGADVTLYPVVKPAHWITYDSQGGSNVDPAYVLANGVTVEPSAPTRKGYTFAGWYTDADCNEEFSFGSELEGNITLYAGWTPAQTSYTVIFWKQQVTDDKNASDAEKKYDYGESVVRTTATGSVVSATDADKARSDYTGFQYNANKQLSVTVAADGSTVLNVYYDRVLMTMEFYRGSEQLYTFEGLYESTLASNGYTWDTNYNWVYTRANGATITQTYMDAFIFPAEAGNATTIKFTRQAAGSVKIEHYIETLNGEWELKITAYGGGGTFHLGDKFVGFTVSAYQRGTKEGNSTSWGTKTDCESGDTVSSGYSELRVYHARNTYTLDYSSNGEIVNSESVKYEQSLTSYESYMPGRPSDLPEYYSFQGWYKDPEGTEKFDFNQTMPTHNLVVYAKWAPGQVTVTFDTQGGTEVAGQTFDAGLTAEKPENPTREGYTFAGWTKDGQPFNFDTQIIENTTLVAQWISEAQYTITYDPNGAVDAEGNHVESFTDSQAYVDGAEAKVAVVREDWTSPDDTEGFICWNTEANGSGTDYYPGDTYTMPAANVTLYAKWAPCRKTTLTYNYNGGTDTVGNGTSEAIPIDVPNSEYTILRDGTGISREGYVFIGWTTDQTGEGTLLQKGDVIQVDTLNPETNVLYAQWQKLLTVTVKKVVDGNMGDKNGTFSFSYTVKAPGDAGETSSGTLQIPADGNATIKDLKPGSVVTITETSGAADGYTTQVEIEGVEDTKKTSSEYEINNLQNDTTVLFTNTREVVPPTGLTDNSAPFTAMVLLSFAGVAGLFLLRRRDRRLM